MQPRYEFAYGRPSVFTDLPTCSPAFRRSRSKSSPTSQSPMLYSLLFLQITQSGLGSSIELYHRTIPFDAILGGGTYIACDRCHIGTYTRFPSSRGCSCGSGCQTGAEANSQECSVVDICNWITRPLNAIFQTYFHCQVRSIARF